MDKYQIRNIILRYLKEKGRVRIAGDILREAFPEPPGLHQDIMIFAFTMAGNRIPPLTQSEQIEQFCRISGLRFYPNPTDSGGAFEKAIPNP